MTKYDPHKHHRRSIRLKGWDYRSAGAYFITICVKGGQHLLGEVVDYEMVLSEYGRIVHETWQSLAERYPYVILDAAVIMPNHFHGIIFLDDGDSGWGGSRPARTDLAPKRKPIGQLVGVLKMVSAKRINQLRDAQGNPFWQRDFYDRIVRNDQELNVFREYILNNPAKWQEDKLNPRAPRNTFNAAFHIPPDTSP